MKTDGISAVFARYLAYQQPSGPLADIAEWLTHERADEEFLSSRLAADLPEAVSELAKEELLDLLLYYIEDCLRDHELTDEETWNIRKLKRLFDVKEGDLYRSRKERTRELLHLQLARILNDRAVDSREALHKVALQEVFDLGYDQFLELIKGPIDSIVDDLIASLSSEGVSATDRMDMLRKVMALDTVYEFNSTQRKILFGELTVDTPGRVIPLSLKEKVWQRDGGVCAECGSREALEFDHIIPLARGGSNTYRNIQLLCERCNRRKSASLG